jgi:hypothetical protein
MAKSQLIRLHSNGNIVNTAEIIGIIRKELNVYGILIRNCPAVLACNGNDVDDIVKYMEIPTLETEDKSKIAV